MKPKLQRFQMQANLEAVLFEHYGLPRLHLLSRFQDRLQWRGTERFVKAISSHPKFAVWNAVANHGPSAKCGWRVRDLFWSTQVVQYGKFGQDDVVIGADVDRVNPERGLGPLLLHGADIAWGWLAGKPDAFQIAKALRKRGITVPEVKF